MRRFHPQPRLLLVGLALLVVTLGVTSACAVDAPTPPPPTPQPAAENATLTIHATGFDSPQGHAIAKLFRPGDNVLSQTSWRRATSVIQNGEARLEFAGLPDGLYALVVFHDENDNGKVDHNALSLPKEQLGFSNGFRLGIFSGMPNFQKLQFRVVHPRASLDIPVR